MRRKQLENPKNPEILERRRLGTCSGSDFTETQRRDWGTRVHELAEYEKIIKILKQTQTRQINTHHYKKRWWYRCKWGARVQMKEKREEAETVLTNVVFFNRISVSFVATLNLMTWPSLFLYTTSVSVGKVKDGIFYWVKPQWGKSYLWNAGQLTLKPVNSNCEIKLHLCSVYSLMCTCAYFIIQSKPNRTECTFFTMHWIKMKF